MKKWLVVVVATIVGAIVYFLCRELLKEANFPYYNICALAASCSASSWFSILVVTDE
jgi:hypothetical protein